MRDWSGVEHFLKQKTHLYTPEASLFFSEEDGYSLEWYSQEKGFVVFRVWPPSSSKESDRFLVEIHAVRQKIYKEDEISLDELDQYFEKVDNILNEIGHPLKPFVSQESHQSIEIRLVESDKEEDPIDQFVDLLMIKMNYSSMVAQKEANSFVNTVMKETCCNRKRACEALISVNGDLLKALLSIY